MAQQYDNKITRNTDWGGDASTGFLPVKGSRVQEFIKDELNTKIGAVYKPEGLNVVYYFANEEDKQAFIETDDMSYVLSSYEMESNYEVKIDEETLVVSHSVLKGTTGNTVGFKFKIVDKDNGRTADARAKIEVSFTGSGISNKFTNEIAVVAGDWTSFSTNIDKYLRDGSNSIAVKITGMTTKATTQFVLTYNMFDLTFNVNFDYNVAKTGNTMIVPYIIECSDPKYLEFFIDGVSVSSSESMVINDIRKDSIATLDISNLSLGQHTLQVRAYVRASDGTLFYTPVYFYTFAKAGDTTTSFLMSRVSQDGTKVVPEGEGLTLDMVQFEQLTFDWSTYDFNGRRLVVNFEYDGKVVTTAVAERNEVIGTFNYRPMEDGEGKLLKIYAFDENDDKIFEYVITVNVAKTESGIVETTDRLIMKFVANGRRNTDENKDVWQYTGANGNTYHATFNGFTWNSQQGWDENTESLVVSNGATVTFDIQPMINDWYYNQGGTLEIDLETFDVDDENAVICELKNNATEGSEAYIRITATDAEFATQNGSKINTRYKDNERLKIAFIGNPYGDVREDDSLIYIVVNGVLERAAMYNKEDHINASTYLTIGDTTGQCKVRLRSIRVYDKAITVDEAFNNYVVDSDDVQGIYEKNNVIKAGTTTEIGFDEVANKLPVMIFTGDMQDIVDNGQDKEWRHFDVEYINRQEPERNFVSFNCQMKLQGTSSLGYPRKNFKLKTKDKNFNQDVYNNSRFELDPNSVVGNLMLRDKTTGLPIDFNDFKTNGTYNNNYCFTLDFEGKALKKGKYRFRKNSHNATKWTLKADFMESSCSHNVGAGRSWNDIFENVALLDNGDASYTNQTYKDSALANRQEYLVYDGVDIEGKDAHYRIPNNTQGIKDQKKYVCRTDAQKQCLASGQDDIRTAVDGFPMVCFYRTSHAENNLVFLGQYNFINDKGSYEVFGFEDIEDPEDEETMIYDSSKVEVWEGLKNTNPLSLFITTDGFYDEVPGQNIRKWQETYEARYPDPEDYESNPEALYELSKWIVSTRHEADTQYSGLIDIDATFAKHINSFQYGYTSDTAESYAYAEGQGLVDNAENRQKKFETEKWDHFDVWKLAGYYIYLRRYGAVDQFVKNTMLFTDGNGKYELAQNNRRTDKKYRKWFFINYDNDCLFGLRNNGQLAFHWDLDRQTIDSASDIIVDDQADNESGMTNSYAMMGHDSTLWNNLERDDEFMRMVRDLDYSMSHMENGLTYDTMVKQFDTEQTEKWCERIYNANERYKYIQAAKGIGDMAGKKVDNLWMLQGTRRSHRHWWIANHFNLLDAQWLSGEYKNTYVVLKTNCESGATVHAVAGTKYYYAWGQQKKIYESNMQRNEGEAIDFVFPMKQSQGDPVYIYAFNKFTEMDFSDIISETHKGSFEFHLGNDLVQNTLRKLVIGNPNVRNNLVTAQDTGTWGVLQNLEYLDVTNIANITYVPVESFNNLHTFKAFGTSLGSFSPAPGSVFDLVELPQTVGSMTLRDISFSDNINSDLQYTPNTTLGDLTISNNAGVGMDYYNKLILPWINAIEASTQASTLYQLKSIKISNINWTFGNLNSVRIFKNFSKKARNGNFQFSGVIDLRPCGNLSMENIEELKEIFGENCFNEKMSSLYIKTPDSIFISSNSTEMVAGQENVFERVIYPDERAVADKLSEIRYYVVVETTKTKAEAEDGEIIFEDPIGNKNYLVVNNLQQVRTGLSLENTRDENNKEIGILRCDELVRNTDTTIKVLVYMNLVTGGFDKISVMNFTIKDPTYASDATIDGMKSLYATKEYTFAVTPKTSNNEDPIGSYDVQWTLTGDAQTLYVEESYANPDNKHEFIVRIGSSQPEVSSPMTVTARVVNHDGSVVTTTYDTLVLNETVIMTRDSNPVAMEICYRQHWATDINAMKKTQAENVTDIGLAFSGISDSFAFPEFVYFTNVTELPASAFSNSNITEIVLHDGITTIGEYCFADCSALKNVYVHTEDGLGNDVYTRTLPSQITSIEEGTFLRCSSLTQLALPEGVVAVEDYAFGGTGFKNAILPTTEEGDNYLKFPRTLATIRGNAFEERKWTPETTTNRLRSLEIPTGLTLTTNEILRGRHYERFLVEEGHAKYAVIGGVLMSSGGDTLMRFPPVNHGYDTYEIPSVLLVYPYAFFAVKGLDELTTFENSTIQTLQEGFCMDSDIKEVNLSQCNIIPELPENAFKNCSKLETISLPTAGTLKKIKTHAFDGCSSMTAITIPYGVEEISCDPNGNSYTFVNCDALQEIEFPDTVVKMSRYAVDDCDSLRKIVFPSYLKCSEFIGSNLDIASYLSNYGYFPYVIVNGCNNLQSVTFPAFSYDETNDSGETVSKTINEYNGIFLGGTTFFTEVNGSTTSKEGISLINGYANLNEVKASVVDNGNVIKIIDGCIYTGNMKELIFALPTITELTIPNGVEGIGSYAFTNSPISSIVFPSTLKRIGTGTFDGCRYLRNVEFPEDFESFGDKSFSNTNLESITVNSGVLAFGNQSFSNNYSALQSVVIKEKGVSNHRIELQQFTFWHARNLGSIVISSTGKVNESGDTVPSVEITHVSSWAWHAFADAGSNVSNKELLVSVGMKSAYENDPMWAYVITGLGYTVKEEIPLSGVCFATIRHNGQPFTGTVYYNGTSAAYDESDGKHMILLEGVYDNEEISLYSDAEETNLIGTLKPRLFEKNYEIGQLQMSAAAPKSRLFSTGLFSAPAATETEEEVVEITKSEYEALLSKVNQMMKIIKTLV